MEHQMLGRWVVCPIDISTQRIILKFVGFLNITLNHGYQSQTASLQVSISDGDIWNREKWDYKMCLVHALSKYCSISQYNFFIASKLTVVLNMQNSKLNS